MRGFKKAAKAQPTPTIPTRAVTFTLPFGEAETLKTVQAALTQARCLGVPDDAKVRITGGFSMYGGNGFTAYFSWDEPLVR